jgi:succinylglutamate desuccinylase
MTEWFPDSYAQARSAFRAGAAAAGAAVSAHSLAARGPDGDVLTIDSAYLGALAPDTLLIMTSGLHGIEGYAGSALQQLWLAEFARTVPVGSGVLLVHALNPFGFAHGRRVNEHNVDLNRNALDRFPGPVNASYRKLDRWLNPASPPSAIDDFWMRAPWHLLRHGGGALTQAIASGQYEFPGGLFYGGAAREPSIEVFRDLIRARSCAAARTVLHVDLHTGLGERGQYQFLLAVPRHDPAFAAFVRWFGAARVASDHSAGATHYVASGMLTELTRQTVAADRVFTAVLEFGTERPARVLKALRAENRLYHRGCRSETRAQQIRAVLREVLYPSDPVWRTSLIAHGRSVFAQLGTALASGLR